MLKQARPAFTGLHTHSEPKQQMHAQSKKAQTEGLGQGRARCGTME
jgi:hypothetical protein